VKKPVFVDTAAWLALLNKSDALHEKAKRVRNKLVKERGQFLLTDYIVVEIANSLSRVPFRQTAVQIISLIQSSANTMVVRVDEEIFGEAWRLYSERLDKEWSFTDCTSFIVMNRMGVTDAFTSDHHFEQAGFNILLKD
jgi:predicted nucleic acid-binding protein